jgi:hypothetical protein
MVMPALIGGFFRRGRVVKDNRIEFYSRGNYNKEKTRFDGVKTPVSSTVMGSKESRLNAAVISNEVWA